MENDNIKWIKNRGKDANKINVMSFTISTKRMYGNKMFQDRIEQLKKRRIMIGVKKNQLIIKPCDDMVGSFKLTKDKNTKYMINISSALKEAFKKNNIIKGKYEVIYDKKNSWFNIDID